MSKKTTKILKYALSFVLAAVLVFFAFRGVDWKAFWQGLARTSWLWVVLFVAASLLALVFRERRWTAMVRALDPECRRIDVWDSINVGNLVNVVLPGAGEFVRCGYLASPRRSYDKVFGTIVCERACDVAAVALMILLALGFNRDTFGVFFRENVTSRLDFSVWWIFAAAAVLLAAFVVAAFRLRERSRFWTKAAGALSGLVSGFTGVARMDRKWAFVLDTVFIWTSYLMMTFCIFKAIPLTAGLGLGDALFVSAVGNLSSVIPVPGGIGAYHYLVALTLQSVFGIVWDAGILFATLSHETHAVLIILLGIISYICLTIRRKDKR